MSPGRTVFTSNNVLLLGKDDVRAATIIVDNTTGKISEVKMSRASREDYPDITDEYWIDAGDKMILPGLVDAHVHLNEPGRTEWEGFYTGTLAAASGGVTTVVDMPLNSIPPTTTVENLQIKRKAAEGQCWVDVAFWGGLVPYNERKLKEMVSAGVKGFKCFLIESGVEEFPCVNESNVDAAMSHMGDAPEPLLFHAELDSEPHIPKIPKDSDSTHYETFLHSRPQKLETDAISLILDLQKKHPKRRCHIVHLSAASALPAIQAAKKAGRPLTVETCFHYLFLSSGTIPDCQPKYKCCPPVRDEDNRDKLWEALLDGTIDCVVSDHSPCVPELKRNDGDVMKAWGGISSLGLGLNLLWTEGQKRGVGIGQICRWTCEKTAKLASLDGQKGGIEKGMDADMIIWDPNAEHIVTKDNLYFKNKLSPYEGMTLRGRVEKTFLRGQLIWDWQTHQGDRALGQLI